MAAAAIDLAALAAYLAARLPEFRGPLTLERFAGGESNPTYRLITPQRSYVMRTKPAPAAQLLPSAHAIEREYRVMAALAGSEVPVARMLLLCEDESVIGRAFYLMALVEGRVLWDPALPGCTPAERAAIVHECVRVLAALHRVDPAAAGLADFGKPGNYFERQIARWTRQYQASVTGPNDAMDRLIEWLPAHIPASARDGRATIVHGDYRLDNLIFDAAAPSVRAVLDWELSTLGHPLADFSYYCMAWHIPHDLFRGIGGLDLAALGLPDEQALIARYCGDTGFADPQTLQADWPFYLAYNLFRIAAIVQGIAKRAQLGTAAGANAGATALTAGPLAALGWRHAQRAG